MYSQTPVLPNVFTPNNDGINDLVDFSYLNLSEEIVDIYDRRGLKVFQSSRTVSKWEGDDLKGNACPDGVYYYVFHYSDFINKTIDKNGFIQLLR
jgi:gliding motility-associated-like protein